MHPDIHLRLHAIRAAELRDETARRRRTAPRPHPLSRRLGWALVETGLWLVNRGHPAAHLQRM